jgi:serine-type D-Ala-D-Ala carboxypeptidase (penicillin-binding protein 5/6)
VRYVVALVVLVIVIAGVFAGIQWTRAIPSPKFEPQVASSVTLSGTSPHFPWPSVGSAAVAVEGVGTLGTYGGDSPQPIASIAKVMTAYIILKDHPLTLGESGPNLSFDATDAATYRTDLGQSQSVIPVSAGESLSELQCLEALLIPSANNIAIKFAQWDSGSVSAFVSKMNATAKSLGMTSTTYTDPSGLQQTTMSSPTDLIRLAEAAMQNSVFSSIVDMPQVTLPQAGTVYNYDYDLGRDGIVGIKTGSDSAAGGCFLFESINHVDGRTLDVFGVVLGQQTVSPITAALNEAKSLVSPAIDDLHEMQAVSAGQVVGHVVTAWNTSTPVTTTKSLSVFGWPGEKLNLTFDVSAIPSTISSGAQLGDLVLSGAGVHQATPVDANNSITGPSDSWRLER